MVAWHEKSICLSIYGVSKHLILRPFKKQWSHARYTEFKILLSTSKIGPLPEADMKGIWIGSTVIPIGKYSCKIAHFK